MQRFCAVKSVEATTLHGNEYILAGMKLSLGQALCARLYETTMLSFHNYVWQMLYIKKIIFSTGERWTASRNVILALSDDYILIWTLPPHFILTKKNCRSFLMIFVRKVCWFGILLHRKIHERKQFYLHCEFTNIKICERVFIYEDQNSLVRLHSGNISLLFVDRVAWRFFFEPLRSNRQQDYV